MGVTLPASVDGVLALMGVPWPNIDEDEIRKDADAWRTVLAGAEPAGARADATVRQTLETYKGDSATALAGYWSDTGASGHLGEAANAARVAPIALDGTATVVTAVKVVVAANAAYAGVRIGMALLAGGPLGVSSATATMLATRAAIGRVLREGAEGTGKVLGPALSRKVTQPLQRILQSFRGPGGGSPMLAGAGGPRVALGKGPDRFDDMPGVAKMGRKDKEKGELNQSGRNPHESNQSGSKRNKHEEAANHGGRRNIPPNPNKRKK
ncbi:hypothetical protein AB0B45_08545 [Nonomuraea sp. NPDC049152]|uniref:WXG100-like domain-containing protein n=1 Tax=Nonomuraea sp. NPDC049152 TaxID=3154350 RepID=UPI0033FE77FC